MNHHQLKTVSVNMPKPGKHKSLRGLLRKWERFNMASTHTHEISIRNRFGIGEISLFSWFCAHFMEARGQGVITLWRMSCIFQYFILWRKTRKINDATVSSGATCWDGLKGGQKASPTRFFPKSDPATGAEIAAMSQHARITIRWKTW